MGSRGKSLTASLRRITARTHKNLPQAPSENESDVSGGESLFDELRENKIKFSEEDTLFITRDQYGKITWLEKGNELVGLKHIQTKHAEQFEKALKVERTDIASYIREVIENGIIAESEPDQGGTRRTYFYKGSYHTIVVTGSNGFITTAFPTRKKKERK